MSVLDSNSSGFDAPDAPRGCSQQEHITGKAFDSEVFIECADDRFFRLCNNKVVRVLRNCAARRDRGETGAAPATDDVIDLIAMKKRPASPPLRRDSFGQH